MNLLEQVSKFKKSGSDQGENDCHNIMGNADASAGYSCEMAALVSQWRKLWSAAAGTTDPAAPFGIVTLASSGSEGASSLAMGAMRQAQTAGFGCDDTNAAFFFTPSTAVWTLMPGANY